MEEMAKQMEKVQFMTPGDTKTENTKHADPKKEDPKTQDTNTKDPNEEDTISDDSDQALEFGGFLAPLPPIHPTATPIDTHARDLNPGHIIVVAGRPCEIVSRKDSLGRLGPLASRHKVELELQDVFDKEALEERLAARATEKLKKVEVERVRYDFVCFSPPSCWSV